MPWGAAATIGAGIISGAASNSAAKTASSAAQSAAQSTSEASLAAAKLAGDRALEAALAAGKSQVEAAEIAAKAARETATANNQLLRENYDRNANVLAPLMQSGTGAGRAINALLGVPTYRTERDPIYGELPAVYEMQPDYEGYVLNNPDIKATYDQYGSAFPDVASFGQWYHSELGAQNPDRKLEDRRVEVTPAGRAVTGYNERQVLDTDAPAQAQAAFQNYLDSSGYQFQLAQGVNALDQSAAARGLLNSGKAVKSVQQYGTQLGSQFLDRYINYLANQQGVGANAANALTGVGNAYATNVSNNNATATNAANSALLGANAQANNALLGATSAANNAYLGGVNASNNALMGAADATGNAALVGANNLSNLLGQAVSAYGNWAGGTSSYGGKKAY